MRWKSLFFLVLVVFACLGAMVAKPKTISFGRWLSVKWMVGTNEDKPLEMKVRGLMVNGEVKEFTTGEPHDVTDRVFVVQRAFRLNDNLPDNGDLSAKPQWSWRPGGWLMVQRNSAGISKLSLADFDAYSSAAVWFRDFVAYCGVSGDGQKIYAIVMQLGTRKPLLRKELGPAKIPEMPNSECEVPIWQKAPTRVTFQPKGGLKVSYEVRSFATEVPPEETRD
jgi:hypothetical protein